MIKQSLDYVDIWLKKTDVTHTQFVFTMFNLKMWNALMFKTMKFVILSYNNKIATFMKGFIKRGIVCRYQAKQFI